MIKFPNQTLHFISFIWYFKKHTKFVQRENVNKCFALNNGPIPFCVFLWIHFIFREITEYSLAKIVISLKLFCLQILLIHQYWIIVFYSLSLLNFSNPNINQSEKKIKLNKPLKDFILAYKGTQEFNVLETVLTILPALFI